MARSKKGPDPLDIEVGHRIRVQRVALRMSQTALAQKIGVTFQQVQKYERGINRVGAGRLTRIANALGVPVNSFFRREGTNQPGEAVELHYLVTPGAVRLVKAYNEITDPALRRALVYLAEATASAVK